MNFVRYMDLFNGLDLLQTLRLRGSDPKYFNDPFDCRVSIDDNDKDFLKRAEMDMKYGLAFGKGGMSPAVRSYNNLIEVFVKGENIDLVSDYRLYCFTHEIDDNHDIIMWSHYSDSHRGLKIRFNSNFNEFVSIYRFVPIIYSDNRIQFKYRDDDDERRQKIEEVLHYKSSVWKYENEYRLITTTNQYEPGDDHLKRGKFTSRDGSIYESEYILIDPSWIDSIDLGWGLTNDEKTQINNIISTKGYPFTVNDARTCAVNYKLHYKTDCTC